MAWVKLDDSMPHHPKILAAGVDGFALDVAGIAYCNRFNTDGFIAEHALNTVLPMLRGAAKVAARLCSDDVNRWERVDGGWLIRDYHDYQPSSEKTKEISKKRAEAGRIGGLKSPGEGKQTESKVLKQDASESVNPVPSRPVPSRPKGNDPAKAEVVQLNRDWPERGWVWEAFADRFQTPTTKSKEKHRWQSVNEVTESLAVTWECDRAEVGREKASYNEVMERADRWPLFYEDATLTERALATHWDDLGREPLRAGKDTVEEYHAEMQRERRRRELAELDAEVKGLER